MGATTILGVFETSADAARALEELRTNNIALIDTSLVTQDTAQHGGLNAPEGAVVGAAWGGLVGLVALVIPGIGPFIAGGAIAAALTGAAAGAVVGGISGALIHNANVPEAEAKQYEHAVKSGKTLLIIKTEEANALDVRRILVRDGAESLREDETDMLGRGASEVMMYSELGGPVPKRSVPHGDVDLQPVPNTVQVASTATYEREIAANHELDLDDTTTPQAALEEVDFDSAKQPGTTLENGARVVSYAEEATAPKPAPGHK